MKTKWSTSITLRGKFLIYSAALFLAFGMNQKDMLMCYLGLFLLFFTLLSFIPHKINCRKIKFTLLNPLNDIYAGMCTSITCKINHPGHLSRYGLTLNYKTLEVDESIYISCLEAGESQVQFQAAFYKRSYSHSSKIFGSTTFPFGIFESKRLIQWDHKQDILPAALSSSKYNVLETQLPKSICTLEDKKEFHSLREYQRGDPVRDIDWKATARMNKGIVRTYKSESSKKEIELLYYPGNEYDLNFEKSLELLQGCLQILIKNGFRVNLKSPLLDEEIAVYENIPAKLKHFLANAQYNPDCLPMDTLKLRDKFTECFVVSAIPYRKWLEYQDFLNEYSISIIDNEKVHLNNKKLSHALV